MLSDETKKMGRNRLTKAVVLPDLGIGPVVEGLHHSGIEERSNYVLIVGVNASVQT